MDKIEIVKFEIQIKNNRGELVGFDKDGNRYNFMFRDYFGELKAFDIICTTKK